MCQNCFVIIIHRQGLGDLINLGNSNFRIWPHYLEQEFSQQGQWAGMMGAVVHNTQKVPHWVTPALENAWWVLPGYPIKYHLLIWTLPRFIVTMGMVGELFSCPMIFPPFFKLLCALLMDWEPMCLSSCPDDRAAFILEPANINFLCHKTELITIPNKLWSGPQINHGNLTWEFKWISYPVS